MGIVMQEDDTITQHDRAFASISFTMAHGHVKIGAHKDDEPTLDQTVDIATLSFGDCRDMIFSKKECKSVRPALEAGCLLLMQDQKEWTHAIPPQPCVKEPRISLTFRRVWSSLQQSLDEMERDYSIPPCKRLRRELLCIIIIISVNIYIYIERDNIFS
ncbi:hypothetical protein AVEN_254391-1 [Araneus ventricosus]|uniref:Fe2OG dioxygenase domain-containing protein n=1 Tax=Araneus ventricosus TaxID=182803 RepID=A0A4Y2V0D7_ARAVE|nr:hypothetical protein AVEN_254391-1 [Araneus ventricosus]